MLGNNKKKGQSWEKSSLVSMLETMFKKTIIIIVVEEKLIVNSYGLLVAGAKIFTNLDSANWGSAQFFD
jgi:hypothetical protein